MTTQSIEFVEQDYEMVPVNLIRPNKHNPNRGDEDALAASVDRNGFYGAVTLRPHPEEDGAYELLAGEHRWRLACRRGVPELPAFILRDIDDVQAVRILLADNEVTRRGTYDQDALDRALESIGDLEGSGFDSVLKAAAEGKREEEAAEASGGTDGASPAASEGEDGDEGPYSSDEDPEADFIREYGVLVMADSELEQQQIFEAVAKMFGANKLRVVSV